MNRDKPAWYYVGNGTFRYWDGDIWTDEYRDGEDAADEPAEEYHGPKHRSGMTARAFLRMIAMGVVVILGAVVFAIVLL